MAISAGQVKELRELTGAGMMDCKKALEASQGNMEGAIEELRKRGRAKADKQKSRVAAEGVVAVQSTPDGKRAVMIEVNSETDFVAREADFLAFVKATTEVALHSDAADVEALSKLPISKGSAQTIEENRQALAVKVGENLQIRRFILSHPSSGIVGSYVHSNRIGVLVELDVDNQDLARDIAMHIAATKPLVISPDDVSPELIEKEKEIYLAQAASSGKPQEIIEKMVVGRLKKYLDEVSLVGQPFVKDPDTTIGSLLSKHRAKVLAFHRFELGEGIEKVSEDFRDAVMSQVQGS